MPLPQQLTDTLPCLRLQPKDPLLLVRVFLGLFIGGAVLAAWFAAFSMHYSRPVYARPLPKRPVLPED